MTRAWARVAASSTVSSPYSPPFLHEPQPLQGLHGHPPGEKAGQCAGPAGDLVCVHHLSSGLFFTTPGGALARPRGPDKSIRGHCFSRTRYGTHGCQAERLPADASTPPEETAGERLSALRAEITQLTTRAVELEGTLGTEPTPPQPAVIERPRAHLSVIITSGTPGERKADIDSFVAEVRITDEGVLPRVPHPRTTPIPENGDPSGATKTTPTGEPVRALVRSVGPVGLEPTL